MNKTKTIIVIILALIISGGLVYLSDGSRIQSLKMSINELETMNSKLYASSTQIIKTNDLQTYKNNSYGFSFMYPSALGFVIPSYPNLEDKIVQLQIPQSDYPRTNFGDAAFSVSAVYTKSLEACLAAANTPENGDGFKSTKEINGLTYYYTKSAGAGAGNLYESTIYRVLVGGQLCVELNETIHTGNIGNFPSGTVTEVDKSAVQTRLDDILNTFKFSE